MPNPCFAFSLAPIAADASTIYTLVLDYSLLRLQPSLTTAPHFNFKSSQSLLFDLFSLQSSISYRSFHHGSSRCFAGGPGLVKVLPSSSSTRADGIKSHLQPRRRYEQHRHSAHCTMCTGQTAPAAGTAGKSRTVSNRLQRHRQFRPEHAGHTYVFRFRYS